MTPAAKPNDDSVARMNIGAVRESEATFFDRHPCADNGSGFASRVDCED